jgi:hypothetical protein
MGFGHIVVDQMVAQQLEGEVKLNFFPHGVSWSLSIPATRFQHHQSSET